MSRSAPNINRFWANLIVEELVRSGVRRFFVAPGSRSSPLVAAVVAHESTDAVLHFDERGTAFAALGYGRATQGPAVWITTSGTAAANGLPAIVEASQSRIPLLAITADRPPELRDTGANQAIDQTRLFGTYPRWYFELPCPSPEIDPRFVLSTVDQAIHRASAVPGGPVHLNCPYREPLAPTRVDFQVPDLPRRWSRSKHAFTTYHHGRIEADASALGGLRDRIATVRRGLILAGELPTIEEAQAVAGLAGDLGWPVLADVTSQMRLGTVSKLIVSHPHFVCSALADRLLPEVILRFGGPISSKSVQGMLGQTDALVVSVQDHARRADPDHNVWRVVRADTISLCRALKDIETAGDAAWAEEWTAAGSRVRSFLDSSLDGMSAVSEPYVGATVADVLPAGHALFVASSMPIRDVDMFGSPKGSLRLVAANRGASGIDGTVASAAGYHLGTGLPVTLLIGDLALLHDLNSLALVKSLPITVVAVNNGGGGIFNFLPIAEHAGLLDPWFTAPHEWSFEHAAATFGLPYACPTSARAFKEAYADATASGEAHLIEVFTERESNRRVHDDLRAGAVRAAQDTAC